MRVLHVFLFCTFSCAWALELFINGPVVLMDCRTQNQDSHLVDRGAGKTHSTEEPVENTTKIYATEEPDECTTKNHTSGEQIEPKELFDAAKDGDLCFIKAAISQQSTSGLDLNWHNARQFGHTPLIAATRENHTRIVATLLEAGANPSVQDEDGFSAVFHATGKGHVGVMNLLLDHGADPNLVSNYGKSPLQEAAYQGYVEAARTLIQGGAHVDYVRAWRGWTALHWAAEYVSGDVALLLLQHGADKNKKDNKGRTPADVAREDGDDELATLIENYSA